MTKFKKKGSFSLDASIENMKFDFSKNLKWFLIAPILIILVGVIILCTLGFNLGIDFTGGSNMTIYIDSTGEYVLDVEDESGEMKDSASLYSLKSLSAIENAVNEVLAGHGLKVSTIQTTAINNDELGIAKENNEANAVVVKYQNSKKLGTAEIEEVNDQIRLELLKKFGYVSADATLDELDNPENLALVTNGGVTTASASAELMMKSFIALLVAMVLILVYVAFRFELTSGLAAILALFHDVLVTASVVLICRIEVNVAFIAALITILGYSINNTIIIFDRMRDELKVAKQSNKKIDNNLIVNTAVKGTMMRSILTMVTTFIMIFFITVIGVADIREFAFPIMVGILAGFYSSVFITPGLWAIAYRPRKKTKFFAKDKKNEGSKEKVVEVEPAIEEDAEKEI